MKIRANQIQLRNVGQLASIDEDGYTTMGRLDGIRHDSETFTLQIAGYTFHVDGDYPIDIRRTANLDAMVNNLEVSKDIVDRLPVPNASN